MRKVTKPKAPFQPCSFVEKRRTSATFFRGLAAAAASPTPVWHAGRRYLICWSNVRQVTEGRTGAGDTGRRPMRMRRRVLWILVAGTLAAVMLLAVAWDCHLPPAAAQALPFDTSEWKTNFKKASVPLTEIRSGGPPKDGIPPIDKPKFESVADAGKWLKPSEPVVIFERGGEARAYPLQILIWHEIVNDTVGGIPASVTFCPLCNTSITFDRRLDGQVLDFGTTGKLHKSALVMYDRQTESWWWQVSGMAIVGDLTGKRLTVLPSQIISWETFRGARPGGKVLSRDTGHSRPYGRNPYVGYDNINSSPFLYTGGRDSRLRPMERV